MGKDKNGPGGEGDPVPFARFRFYNTHGHPARATVVLTRKQGPAVTFTIPPTGFLPPMGDTYQDFGMSVLDVIRVQGETTCYAPPAYPTHSFDGGQVAGTKVIRSADAITLEELTNVTYYTT